MSLGVIKDNNKFLLAESLFYCKLDFDGTILFFDIVNYNYDHFVDFGYNPLYYIQVDSHNGNFIYNNVLINIVY